MEQYKRLDHTAVISEGPVYGYSTRNGTKVALYRVRIDGHVAYHAPTKELCREWLIRQAYFPTR